MASVTLENAVRSTQDLLISGVIGSLVKVNRLYQHLPFRGVAGDALAFKRYVKYGDAQLVGADGAPTEKSPAEFSEETAQLATIIGKAEVNPEELGSSNFDDVKKARISSEIKQAARKYQDLLINGTGQNGEFKGLAQLVSESQKISSGENGGPLTFDKLDELLDAVTAKDGEVDFLIVHPKAYRKFLVLLRSLGGALTSEAVKEVWSYRGVPIFVNNYIPSNETVGTNSNTTTIYAGVFDDGTDEVGLAGLIPRGGVGVGVDVEDAGTCKITGSHIYHIKWQAGLALFHEKGLAALTGVHV